MNTTAETFHPKSNAAWTPAAGKAPTPTNHPATRQAASTVTVTRAQ
ncbi:hypothetical protein ABZV91_08250 [Nocardia sp. NPDC004568]